MTAKRTGAELVVRALEDEGIALAFGIPGTHNIELYDALAASTSVRAVLVTDEQSASFMADAAFRASGRLACVNVVPGAGLTHAMSGIAEAFMDGIPMLVLGCGIRRDTGKAYQLHDVDQAALVRPVTKAQLRPSAGGELYGTVRKACRLAREGTPGPVFVEVPADQYLFRHDDFPGDVAGARAACPRRRRRPSRRRRGLLGEAKRPLLYLGLGAAGAGATLVALAEKLEAPVSTTFQGKGVFPESHPLWLWPGFGDAAPSFATERRRLVRRDARDRLPVRRGRDGKLRTHPSRDADPRRHRPVGARAGTTRPTSRSPPTPRRSSTALLPRAPDAGAATRPFGSASPRDTRRWTASGPRSFGPEGSRPHLLLRELQATFGPETVFTTDSGNGTFLAVEGLRLERPGRLLAPVDYSCMGYAVPAALGAKLACPGAPVVSLAGDGAFLMTGLELLTAAQNGLGVAVFVLRDRELAQIAQFQSTALGRKTASELPDYDLAGLARSLGVEALTLADDAGIPEVVARAKEIASEGRPVLVDTAIDYSRKTYFTRGVVRTNFGRLPWGDRLRFVVRALGRKVHGRV